MMDGHLPPKCLTVEIGGFTHIRGLKFSPTRPALLAECAEILRIRRLQAMELCTRWVDVFGDAPLNGPPIS
jgi:hypothetical protein